MESYDIGFQFQISEQLPVYTTIDMIPDTVIHIEDEVEAVSSNLEAAQLYESRRHL